MNKKIYGFRKGLITLFAVMGLAQLASAQVGVGTTTPDASAQLEVVSTNKGILIPRVTNTSAVTLPAPGLLVYQTGGTAGFYYNSGTALVPAWLKIATGSTELADEAVTNAKVSATAAIAYSKLALNNSIANGDLTANSITTSNVADGTIITSKISDSAVSGLKILTNAVNNAHIANGTLNPAKLSTSGATNGQVLGYNSGAIGWTTPASGGSSGTDAKFSASLSTLITSASTQLTGWTVSSPYFPGTTFNAVTGNYTVPQTGTYHITANVNYATLAAVSISLGAGVNPSFVIRRTSPTVTDLVTGNLPILNVNVALVLTLRTILANANVPMSTTVQLTAGDVIGLFYVANGLTLSLDLGGPESQGVQWSITKVSVTAPE